MPGPNNAAEQSMEEILASIRKIIAEEPIGTRPETASQGRSNANPSLPIGAAASPPPQRAGVSGAISIDDVLDQADGASAEAKAGPSGGASAANGAANRRWSFANPFGGAPPAKAPSPGNAMVASETTRNGSREEVKPFFPPMERTPGPAGGPDLGGVAPDQAAKPAAAPDDPAPPEADPVLVEAREKVARHLGKPVTEAERPAPLGLRSIRDAASLESKAQEPAKRPAAEGLVARTAAAGAQANAETAGPYAPAGRTASSRAPSETASVPAASVPAASRATERQSDGKAASHGQNAEGPQQGRAASGAGTPTAADPVRTLEATIAEMLRPVLREWLDANLPRMVQQVLREEMSKSPLPGKDGSGA